MHHFRQATTADAPAIWTILQQAIARRKAEGSNQWQDGYPNETIVAQDIEKGVGYVLTLGETLIGYSAVLVNDEPEYAKIQGRWLTEGDFVVFHRVAIAETHLGQGWAKQLLQQIENLARQLGISSIKADTNFDNGAMLALFAQAGYSYCGEVYFRGSPRKAFEKVLR